MKKIFSIVALTLLISLSAEAGIVMTSTQTFSGPSGAAAAMGPMTTKVYIDAGRVRAEISGGAVDKMVMIFRQDTQTYWILNGKDNKYTEMKLADLKKVQEQANEQMEKMKKQMESSMAQLPPEMKQKALENMNKLGTTSAYTPPVYTKVASGEMVGAWSCDKYEGVVNGEKTQQVWTTSPSNVGLGSSEIDMLKSFAEYFQKNSGNTSYANPYMIEGEAKPGMYSGIPVKMLFTRKDFTGQTEVKEIVKQDTPASLFDLPAGAQKQEVPDFTQMMAPKK